VKIGNPRAQRSEAGGRAGPRALGDSLSQLRLRDLRGRPKPTMPGTFSVPARSPRSCPPAVDERLEFELAVLFADVERADPLGTVHLVGGDGHQVDGNLVDVERNLPSACTASQWNTTPRSRAINPISRTGCSTPISLLAAMTEMRIVLSEWRAQGGEIDQASRGARQAWLP
jgi:hypothetical protein